MTTFLTPRDAVTRATPPHDTAHASQPHAPAAPRVLYIDAEDDLPQLLDRVEEAGGAAIIVLPESARAVRGTVAARLLKRRAAAAGIDLVAVTTDRTARAALQGVGIPIAQTVGDARPLLPAAAAGSPRWQGATPPPAAPPAARPSSAAPPRPAVPAQAASDEDDDWFASTEDDEADRAPEEDADDDRDAPARSHGTSASDALARAPTMRMPRIDPHQATDTPDHAHVPPRQTGARRSPVAMAGRIMRLIACLAVLALVAVGAWTYFFPTATVAIHYGDGVYDRTYSAIAGRDVPIHTTHLSKAATETVAASGSKQLPDGTAGGEITLANPLSGAVIVPAGTIVTTTGGIRFATQAEIAVPAARRSFSGTTYGQASVHVGCTEAGPIGNVAAGMIQAIEGRLRGAVLVTNYSGFGGGTMRTVYSITPGDIAGAAARLRDTLTAQLTGDLHAKFAHSPARRITRIAAGKPAAAAVSRNGRLYARVTLTERIDMAYLHRDEVQRFADGRVDADLRARNLHVVPGTLTQRIQVRYTGGAMQIAVQARARTVPLIDKRNLQGLLVGRSLSDARILLDGSARYGGWTYTIRLTPDWGQHLPQSAGLIHITTQAG